MRLISFVLLLFFAAPSAFARPFACAELDALSAAGTALAEICISDALVILKPKTRVADNFFYAPRFLGSMMSAQEYELVPVTYRGSAKGAALRIVIQPSRTGSSQDLASLIVGSRVTLIGRPDARPVQHDINGFIRKDLLLY